MTNQARTQQLRLHEFSPAETNAVAPQNGCRTTLLQTANDLDEILRHFHDHMDGVRVVDASRVQ